MGVTEKSKKVNLRSYIEYSSGSVVSKTMLEEKCGTITLFAFDAGTELSEHTAPFDAMVQVVDGKALITIDGKPHELEEEDIIIMPADIPHAVKANGPFKMLLTMIRKKPV